MFQSLMPEIIITWLLSGRQPNTTLWAQRNSAFYARLVFAQIITCWIADAARYAPDGY